ncbi:hypothetical protein JHK86_021169 [Glycine max]|nr:hypothetical protein JHK86_021169 [Glycine max]
MAVHGSKRWAVKWVAEKVLVAFLLLVSVYVASSQQNTDQKTVSSASNETKGIDTNAHHAEGFYKHTWPEMKFGWKIIVGSIIGFLGSAFGTVGGVGGGGIFVPMLTLIIGFDARSATAISKCLSFNAFFKGVKTWKKETIVNKVPITVGTTVYEAVLLYKGKRKIASKGDQQTRWRVHQLILYCTCGIIAGIIGGLLGLGGGFILGPLFIGLGIHPQVSSATSTFAMTFSASMSVVEYYLLKRFPIPYALYFVAVATAAALVGQHLVRKVIAILGRTSLIIFILALTVFRPMAVHVPRRWDVKWVVGKALIAFLLLVSVSATSSHQNTDNKTTSPSNGTIGVDHHAKAFYKHHWPSMKFGWRIIVGAVVGFLGSAFGTVGGVGGGGIFVPMLTLIVGFDQKSATAISKYIGSPEDDAHYIQTGDPTKDDTNQSRKKVPIAVGMSSYEAVRLYKGKRIIASKGDKQTHWCVLQLVLFCACGTLAGMIAGLLGLGGGFILGPLFLGLGIPPQVASATSTLVMAFSASMAVVEYYLLKRFPVPYALYFVAIATAAALVGQHLVRKAIAILGRASVIIFILTLTLSVSAVLLGGVGIAHMIQKIENKEYMGFGDLCTYRK